MRNATCIYDTLIWGAGHRVPQFRCITVHTTVGQYAFGGVLNPEKCTGHISDGVLGKSLDYIP